MSINSQSLFDGFCSDNGRQRSSAYVAGMLAALALCCGEQARVNIPFSDGAAEADAWYSGVDEGFQVFERHVESLSLKERNESLAVIRSRHKKFRTMEKLS
ncbi:hypothetical protein [Mariprofundus ferrooxydans]|uniref:hypothetical protein n=1 Tax=Mariprofundus ferrooxydans TaxID=314344 RepID=UPI0014306448|nr:hypothetical protein [Mariprofundus ferrooxydans]